MKEISTKRGGDVSAFLEAARAGDKAGTRGRLVFGLDATAGRQPTWDIACGLQADMFREVSMLDVQLVYYRGAGECRVSRWFSDDRGLADAMGKISCVGGHTQISKVLAHARRESDRQKIQALVFVGDAMEENVDQLCAIASELGQRGVPAFMFQEGTDPIATSAFRDIARLSNGAYCNFDPGSAAQLAELLRAVAAYATGGRQALSARGTAAARLLLQLRG